MSTALAGPLASVRRRTVDFADTPQDFEPRRHDVVIAGLAAQADVASHPVHAPVVAAARVGFFEPDDIAGLQVAGFDVWPHPKPIASSVALMLRRNSLARSRAASAKSVPDDA